MRFAVWNTAFLGDAVLTLPLIRAVRAAWPQAAIDCYLRRDLGALFAAQSALNRVYEIGPSQRSPVGMLGLFRQVAGRRYDVWIGAHGSHRSSFVALASGAPVRVGYTGAWHRQLAYTHTTDRCFGVLDEIERLLELLRPLRGLGTAGPARVRPTRWQEPAYADAAKTWPPAWPAVCSGPELPQAVLEEAAAFRGSLPPGPVLGLHPGSVWGTKRWTTEGFAAVARLAVEAGANLILFAGPGEEDTATIVLEQAGLRPDHPQVRDLSGRLDLLRLAAWQRGLDCYLTNDSGPMHLAWIQDVPVVALFGPTVRAFGFFPRGKSVVLEVSPADSPACRPCGLHGPQACPRGDHACMTGITPDRVWETVRERLFTPPCRG